MSLLEKIKGHSSFGSPPQASQLSDTNVTPSSTSSRGRGRGIFRAGNTLPAQSFSFASGSVAPSSSVGRGFGARSSNDAASSPGSGFGDRSFGATGFGGQTSTASGGLQPNVSSDDWEDDEPALTKTEISRLNKVARACLEDVADTDIEVLRSDPNNPLHAVKSFPELHLRSDLLNGLYDMGFDRPSKIQEHALPTLLCDPPQNMIAQSQSGTGKTAAFVLAMLFRVEPSELFCQALCLVPTYELALQIADVARQMGKHINGLVVCQAVRQEQPVLNANGKLAAHIVIGTPGKTDEWIKRRRIIDPEQIKIFVLDEADNMIDERNHQHLSLQIQKRLSTNCQYLLFSATYDEKVMSFANSLVPNAIVIRLKRSEETLANIRQFVVELPTKENKYEAICALYGVCTVAQSMIFVATRHEASWLAEKLTKDGHPVGLLIGSKPVDERENVIRRFRDCETRVLIATNVAARGLDISSVNVVVNYDLPRTMDGAADCETYLHRIGRSGRFGKLGFAINMVDSPESVRLFKEIEEHFNIEIPLLDLKNEKDLMKLEKLAKSKYQKKY